MTLEVIGDLEDASAVARKAALDLAQELEGLLEAREGVNLVLTGGTVGIKTLEELAPLIKNFDLSRLFIWWGDERFVSAESPERNFVQARAALLSKIEIPARNIHAMPSTEDGNLEEASKAFAKTFGSVSPRFDIVLLGMGGDGHVASLFPGSTPIEIGNWVIAEPDSPKEPPQRISMSAAALSGAKDVWFLVAGHDKAEAVSRVFQGEKLPAGTITGTSVTRWYLDKAAASEIIS